MSLANISKHSDRCESGVVDYGSGRIIFWDNITNTSLLETDIQFDVQMTPIFLNFGIIFGFTFDGPLKMHYY